MVVKVLEYGISVRVHDLNYKKNYAHLKIQNWLKDCIGWRLRFWCTTFLSEPMTR